MVRKTLRRAKALFLLCFHNQFTGPRADGSRLINGATNMARMRHTCAAVRLGAAAGSGHVNLCSLKLSLLTPLFARLRWSLQPSLAVLECPSVHLIPARHPQHQPSPRCAHNVQGRRVLSRALPVDENGPLPVGDCAREESYAGAAARRLPADPDDVATL